MTNHDARARHLLTRRPALALFASAALAPVVAARRTLRGQDDGGMDDGAFELDFATFLAEAVPQAKDLIGDTSRAGQDRYLHALAALAACLRDVPVPEMRETTAPGAPARTFLGANECEAPF